MACKYFVDLKHVKYTLFKLLYDLKKREKDEVTCGMDKHVINTFKLLCDLKKKEKN